MAQLQDIPRHSPRHPDHMAEPKRVMKLLARDEAERMASAALRADLAAEKEAERVARENRVAPKYERKVTDKPPVRRGYEVINPSDPKIKQRYRVTAPRTHPLFLARAKLGPDLFNAGNIYRMVAEMAEDPAGRDSLMALNVTTGSAKSGDLTASVEQASARKFLKNADAAMGRANSLIALKFCGEGRSMADAVHSSVSCHRDGVFFRTVEALEAFNEFLAGRKLEHLFSFERENRE